MKNCVFVALFLGLFSCTGKFEPKTTAYRAGFKTIHWTDSSRLYKIGSDTSDYLRYRPIDLDVWYPADSSATDSGMIVRDLLTLLEQRANYYTASNAGAGLAAQIAQVFSAGFKCSDSTGLLNFKTKSFRNATAAKGKFPLVVYFTAFNGMSYENFSLFEDLAKQGFVVVSISSIGRFPGDMTMKTGDLMEQVNDGISALEILRKEPNIDLNKIGIVGYSWGGLAGALFAGKTSASCLVSLEGSEYHHYGGAKDENEDFDTTRYGSAFTNLHLSIPYLRLESAPSSPEEKIDSVYNFSAEHAGNAQIFQVDSAAHEDFGCFSLIVPESGHCPVNVRYTTASKLTVTFLKEHIKNETGFSELVKKELNSSIRQKH